MSAPPRQLLASPSLLGAVTLALALSVVLWGAGAAGCASPDEERPPLRVYAASSLTDAFEALAASFEEEVGEAPSLVFAGSQILRLQIEQGAEADLFASADPSHLRALEEAGMIADSEVFAENEIVLALPRNGVAEIRRFADLRRAERIVVGDPAVPVGGYTQELLRRAARSEEAGLGEAFARAVRARIVSEESNVRLVRAKLELGEADAAILYRSDLVSARGVRSVPIPAGLSPEAELVSGTLRGSSRPGLAARWRAHLRSEEGGATLRRYGLEPP